MPCVTQQQVKLDVFACAGECVAPLNIHSVVSDLLWLYFHSTVPLALLAVLCMSAVVNCSQSLTGSCLIVGVITSTVSRHLAVIGFQSHIGHSGHYYLFTNCNCVIDKLE